MNYSIGEKAVLLPNTKKYLWRSNKMIHSGPFRLCRSKAKWVNTALFWTSSGWHAMVWGRKWNSTKFTLNSENKRTNSQLGVCAALPLLQQCTVRRRRRGVNRWRPGEGRRGWRRQRGKVGAGRSVGRVIFNLTNIPIVDGFEFLRFKGIFVF